MKGALEKVSNTPADQLDIQDKIWAKDLRELSYDIEDNIDTFMVRGEGNEQAKLRGIKKFIDRSVGLFRKVMVRHGIATEIRDIKSRVEEVAKRHDRCKLSNSNVAKHVPIDPRLLYQYDKVTEIVGIEEARDEIIRILMEGNEVSKQQDKIISIVGFGGLGKTTLADVVYKKLRAQFESELFFRYLRHPTWKNYSSTCSNNLSGGKVTRAAMLPESSENSSRIRGSSLLLMTYGNSQTSK
ncbi:putative disease resistance protein At1g50180 [Setaria italica]|uniref:putative disease resistance protein At1g50180 n=1 Tax=Setaria italica TaxID=4555 RepID=UPI000BE6127E|nr:putative disease resistance protein At1g50180 [Setaria italica]